MKRQHRPTYSIPAEQAWAAAFTAWRINGNAYIKIGQTDTVGQRSNREIMIDILTKTPEQIVEQDRELGLRGRSRLGSEISYQLLIGKPMSEWQTMQARICNTETFSTIYDLSVLASLPESYAKLLKNDQMQDQLNSCQDQVVGQGRVQLDITVVKCIYSSKHYTWFVWAIDRQNHAVRFAYRQAVRPGTSHSIVGTVKNYRNRISYLNRVVFKNPT